MVNEEGASLEERILELVRYAETLDVSDLEEALSDAQLEIFNAFRTGYYPDETMEAYRKFNDIYYKRSDGMLFSLFEMLAISDEPEDKADTPYLFENLFRAIPYGLGCTDDPEDYEEVFFQLSLIAGNLGKNGLVSDRNRTMYEAAVMLYDEFRIESERITEDSIMDLMDNLQANREAVSESLMEYFRLAEKTYEKPSKIELKSALAQFLGSFFSA